MHDKGIANTFDCTRVVVLRFLSCQFSQTDTLIASKLFIIIIINIIIIIIIIIIIVVLVLRLYRNQANNQSPVHQTHIIFFYLYGSGAIIFKVF